jgi:hypothetical protein
MNDLSRERVEIDMIKLSGLNLVK